MAPVAVVKRDVGRLFNDDDDGVDDEKGGFVAIAPSVVRVVRDTYFATSYTRCCRDQVGCCIRHR